MYFSCLFSLSDALSFLELYGGFVYMVEVDSTIYHRAEMNKLENFSDVIRFTDDSELYRAIAYEYWKARTHTFAPAYEIL